MITLSTHWTLQKFKGAALSFSKKQSYQHNEKGRIVFCSYKTTRRGKNWPRLPIEWAHDITQNRCRKEAVTLLEKEDLLGRFVTSVRALYSSLMKEWEYMCLQRVTPGGVLCPNLVIEDVTTLMSPFKTMPHFLFYWHWLFSPLMKF